MEESTDDSKQAKTLQLHEEIKRSMKMFHFDPYETKVSDNDLLIQSCMEHVHQDTVIRKRMNEVPSAIRDRFQSSYWRKWDHDLKVLENACRKSDLSNPSYSSCPSTKLTSCKLSGPNISKISTDKGKKVTKTKIKRTEKGPLFGIRRSSPPAKYDEPKPKHPEIAVRDMMKSCNIKITKNLPGLYENFDPEQISKQHVKGGRFS